MSKTYREQLLQQLADGEWHDAVELAHPLFELQGLQAFIRLLRAEGVAIEEDTGSDPPRYRLSPPSSDS